MFINGRDVSSLLASTYFRLAREGDTEATRLALKLLGEPEAVEWLWANELRRLYIGNQE